MDNYKSTVLIVEDNADILELNKRKLTRSGLNVLTSTNLAQARVCLDKYNVDLIILDVMLPDGNGFDFCKEVKQKNDIFILFLTGKTQTEDKLIGLNGGGDYYLTKPYDFDEFVAVVKSLLRRKNSDEIKIGSLCINRSIMIATVQGVDLILSPKEFTLLTVLAANINSPLSSEELCKKCWQYNDTSNTDSILWTSLSRLRKKLEPYDFIHITNIRNKGYVLEVNM